MGLAEPRPNLLAVGDIDDARTFGELLLRLRRAAKRTQTEQADVLCRLHPTFTRNEWSRYETDKRIPNPYTVRLIAQSFNVPQEALLRAASTARAEKRRNAYAKNCRVVEDVNEQQGVIGASSPFGGSPEDGREKAGERHSLEQVKSGNTAGGTEPWPWEAMELMRLTQASDVSETVINALEVTIDSLCRAYPFTPADQLHRKARGGIRYVTSLLDKRTRLAQHRDLLVCAGWLFLLSGCLEYDLNQADAANVSRAAALSIGEETGHGEMIAWAWELEAWFSLTQGKYANAVACAEAGNEASPNRGVAVQLHAQKAKAYARMGDSRMVRSALDSGRSLLERLPRQEHPEHHFVIDHNKWDFYEMDAYRLLGDDERAAHHAQEVIRLSTTPNGTEASPMRAAEARLTLGFSAARQGELEQAVDAGQRALRTRRKSLPSLLMIAKELDSELQARYPREAPTREYRDSLIAVTQPVSRELDI